MPKISIVVPVRNGAIFLENALESIAKQSFKDWECLVWDDGSTDESRAIALHWMNQDSRFRVGWSEQPEGLPQALNNAYSLCRGEYLGQCDSDDRLTPCSLEKCLGVLESDRSLDMIHTDSLVMDISGNYLGWGHSRGKIFNKFSLLKFSPVLHFRLMSSNLMQRLGGYDEHFSFAEDYHFTLRAAWGIHRSGKRVRPAKIHHLRIPLYLRRTHPKQMTKINSIPWQEARIGEISRAIASQVCWSPSRFWRIKTLLEALEHGVNLAR